MRPREVFTSRGFSTYGAIHLQSWLSQMGNRQKLRKAFFADHPRCCFCGGGASAVEEDHIPARTMFRRREWPQGYVFPACIDCNRASAIDELAMSWLVRITIREPDAEAIGEMSRSLIQLHDRRPDWVASMKELNRTETRQYLRERGLSLESFKGVEIEVVKMPPELLAVPQRYGEKLGRALYYLHTGRVLPSDGLVHVQVYPNTDFMSTNFPLDEFGILTERPTVSRSGKSIADQFFYRFSTVSNGEAAAFLVQFGESVAMSIFTFDNAAKYAAIRALKASLPIAAA